MLVLRIAVLGNRCKRRICSSLFIHKVWNRKSKLTKKMVASTHLFELGLARNAMFDQDLDSFFPAKAAKKLSVCRCFIFFSPLFWSPFDSKDYICIKSYEFDDVFQFKRYLCFADLAQLNDGLSSKRTIKSILLRRRPRLLRKCVLPMIGRKKRNRWRFPEISSIHLIESWMSMWRTLRDKSQHFIRNPDNTPALAINKLSNITVFPLAKENTLYQ